MAEHTKACAWWAGAVFSREGAVLHENLAEGRGGERKHISAAVSRSKMRWPPPRRVGEPGCSRSTANGSLAS